MSEYDVYPDPDDTWIPFVEDLARRGGGIVRLAPGQYRVPVGWKVPSNIALHGAGFKKTYLKGDRPDGATPPDA